MPRITPCFRATAPVAPLSLSRLLLTPAVAVLALMPSVAHAVLTTGQTNLGAIWFVGDSITQGVADGDANGSPRKSLYDKLTTGGYANNFTFTGSSKDNTDGFVEAAQPNYIYHSGYSAAMIKNPTNYDHRVDMTRGLDGTGRDTDLWGTNQWNSGRLATVKPDVILIMLGTNDIHQMANIPGRTASTIAADLQAYVNAIYTMTGVGNPTVFISTIAPNRRSDYGRDCSADVVNYNSQLTGIVNNLKSSGKDVYLVDAFTPLNINYATDMNADALHPNAAGNTVIAQTWYDGIQSRVNPVTGTSLSWDPGATPSTPSGGSGTWGLGSNWSNGSTDALWTDTTGTTTAVFGGAGGAVSIVATGVTANKVTFGATTGSGYTISGGTLTLAGTAPTITNNNSFNTTISSVIAGSAGLTYTGTGTGTLTLTGVNTYTGNTNIAADTLEIGGSGSLGSGNYAGVISGTGKFTYSSSATQTLTGANTYTGTTTINAGKLILNQTGNPGTTLSGAIIVNNGTLAFGSYNELGQATTAAVTINTGGVVDSSGTVTTLNNLTLAGGTLKSTGGFNGSWGSFALLGTLTVSADSLIQNTSGSNNLISNGQNNGAQTLTIDVASGKTLTNELAIQNFGGTYAITKTGLGTAIFKGASTYTGGTTITGGKLVTGNTAALGAGAVSVGAAGTLSIGSGGVNTVTLGSGATLATTTGATLKFAALNTSTGAITMAGTGTFTLAADTKLDITGLGLGIGNYILITGTASGGTMGSWNSATDLIGGSAFTYTLSKVGNNAILGITAVPEPSTYGLMGAGALAAAAFVRRRRKASGKIVA